MSEYRYGWPSNYTATGAYVQEPRDAARDHRGAAPSNYGMPPRADFPEHRELYRAYRHLGWLLGFDPQGPVHPPPPLPLLSSPTAAAPARRQAPRAQPPMPPPRVRPRVNWAPRTNHLEDTSRPPMGRRPPPRGETVPTVPRTSAAQVPPQPRPAILSPSRESTHANTDAKPRRTNRPQVVRFDLPSSTPQPPPLAPTPKRVRPSRGALKTAVASAARTPIPNPNVNERQHPPHGCTACGLYAAHQPLLAALLPPLSPRQQSFYSPAGYPKRTSLPYTAAQLACVSRFDQSWMNSRAYVY